MPHTDKERLDAIENGACISALGIQGKIVWVATYYPNVEVHGDTTRETINKLIDAKNASLN